MSDIRVFALKRHRGARAGDCAACMWAVLFQLNSSTNDGKQPRRCLPKGELVRPRGANSTIQCCCGALRYTGVLCRFFYRRAAVVLDDFSREWC